MVWGQGAEPTGKLTKSRRSPRTHRLKFQSPDQASVLELLT